MTHIKIMFTYVDQRTLKVYRSIMKYNAFLATFFNFFCVDKGEHEN